MKALHSSIDKNGRLLIPHQIRNAMKLKAGDSFIINKVNNELHLVTLHKAEKEAQALFKQHGSKSESFVDEFLKQKYQEANKENSKF
ncbi:hypothetical protein RMONA_04525 [Rickettsia monacensis]|uniref:SpoVT-AbrB domain-containing protein n=2 Tax=Rickettsia monacensis TaxID=109232 RepID=A0A0B7J2W7_9RICK|nr:hypothetical protein RMONA_4025 [Rickettsia monacensis IrR/Munich]CEO17290.1 hypothetical protein RMONA_04525 [Rickettsia monacensis]